MIGPRETPVLTIVVPVYNESAGLAEFHRRARLVTAGLGIVAEIVFVNDGSEDDSLQVLMQLRQSDALITVVDLSRNFGKEVALMAGLDNARGNVVVIIDADLQDPPELIPELLAAWREGFDMVYAKRLSRGGESWLKRFTAHLFYRAIQNAGRFRIPEDTGDFRLLSRRAVDALLQLREQHRFTKGLFAWIGFPQKAVPYHREPRHAGKTHWSYWSLWNFALDGVTSFTSAPLKFATYFGLLVALVAFGYGTFLAVVTMLEGNPVPGYPSLMVVMLFLGGVQLMALGVLGEYIGRMFDETKRRPLYFVNGNLPSALSRFDSTDRRE